MRSRFEDPLLVTIPLLILDGIASFAITIPFVGILVRYRAHYSPKAVQLQSEDGAQEMRTGPVINGYFSTLTRVYKLEGWAGLYKGAMPELLVLLLIAPLTIIPILLYGTDSGNWPKLETLGLPALIALGIASLVVSLPITILSYRTIVTPYKLSCFALRQNLRILLTPAEHARPWMLYLTPGLFFAQLLKVAVIAPALTMVQRYILPDLPRSGGEIDRHFILQFSAYVILIVLGTSVIVPLEVITTRLALQRNHASQTGQDSTNETEPVLSVYSAEEDVIGLRDENDPYTSFLDSLKRMASEEGGATLFRAWWITFIPVFAAGMLEAGMKPNFHT